MDKLVDKVRTDVLPETFWRRQCLSNPLPLSSVSVGRRHDRNHCIARCFFRVMQRPLLFFVTLILVTAPLEAQFNGTPLPLFRRTA